MHKKEQTIKKGAGWLVDYFDGELDFVGFFVGVEFDEGFEEAGHG